MTVTTDQTSREMIALNADVVGYSRLLADDFETTTATMDEYRHLVETQIGDNNGTLVNFVGDNFMAVFDEATDAMRASIAISAQIEVRNADVAGPKQVRFRMGLDQGTVAVTGDQWFGDALNIAARIQGIAPPGGVSVSGKVYRAMDEPALRFRAMGRQDLKNIPEGIDVYQFADLPADRPGTIGPRALALESPTVAVLPIHTETVDDSVRAAAQMVRADVVHRLSQVPNLSVIDASDDLGESAPDRTARYVLETGIHQFGDQVRVYATLMDGATWNVASSDRWTATKDDILSLSDQTAEGVARSIEIDLIVGEPAGIYNEFLGDDPESLHKVYLGWYHLTSGTMEGWQKAVDLFDDVAAVHPDRPTGHVLAAFAKWMGASQGVVFDPSGLYGEAHKQARRGIETGDPTGLAHMVEAAILMSEGKAEKALEIVESAEMTRPTCDAAYALEGSVRRYLGDWEKSVNLMDRAMRLTPVNKPWYPTVQACSLYIGGRFEQAAATAEGVLEHQPNNLEALLVLTATQVELGMERRARATAALISERYPSVKVEEWLANHPYQVPEMVERWKQDLATAGLIS